MRTGVELCIQKRLRDKCLSKEEVQQQTGISSERLEQLEKGKAKPTYKEIGLLADYFHIKPESLLYSQPAWQNRCINLILAVFVTLLGHAQFVIRLFPKDFLGIGIHPIQNYAVYLYISIGIVFGISLLLILLIHKVKKVISVIVSLVISLGMLFFLPTFFDTDNSFLLNHFSLSSIEQLKYGMNVLPAIILTISLFLLSYSAIHLLLRTLPAEEAQSADKEKS